MADTPTVAEIAGRDDAMDITVSVGNSCSLARFRGWMS